MKANNRRAELVAIIAAELAAASIMHEDRWDLKGTVDDADLLVTEVERRNGGPIYEEEV